MAWHAWDSFRKRTCATRCTRLKKLLIFPSHAFDVRRCASQLNEFGRALCPRPRGLQHTQPVMCLPLLSRSGNVTRMCEPCIHQRGGGDSGASGARTYCIPLAGSLSWSSRRQRANVRRRMDVPLGKEEHGESGMPHKRGDTHTREGLEHEYFSFSSSLMHTFARHVYYRQCVCARTVVDGLAIDVLVPPV